MAAGKRRRSGEHPTVARMLASVKGTSTFASQLRRHTVSRARARVRELGERRWYSMKKAGLVAFLVLDALARRIQRFARTRGGNVRRRREMFRGLEEERCAITLASLSDIPVRHRYRNGRSWFDRRSLSRYLRTSCDFVHPVTRVGLTRNEVVDIDAALGPFFENRHAFRTQMVSRMETLQCVENELEDVFREMIEMACVAPTRREFHVTMSYCEVQFEQCFQDLLRLDAGRCVVALKSLPDLIEGDPVLATQLPTRRRRELRELVGEFVCRAGSG